MQASQQASTSTSKSKRVNRSSEGTDQTSIHTGNSSAIVTEEKRPRILFMGPRSAGKSSIRKVVFERMAPNDTLFIEKSTKSTQDDVNAFISLDMFDLPSGPLDPTSWPIAFDQLDAVIFVLDAQSSFHDMNRKLAITMFTAFNKNPGIQFEIFLHKIDGMSEDYRLDTLQNLRDRLTEDLFDLSPVLESSMNVFYHLTSVFDTSVYEALSRVIQKLLPEQAMLERLLDLLCQQCSMDKAFLFDTSSKIYIATDSSPLDNQLYVICSDYIDLVGDFSVLYEPNSVVASPFHSRTSSTTSRVNSLLPLSSTVPASPPVRHGNGNHATEPTINKEMISSEEIIKSGMRLASSRVKLGTGATIAQWCINSNLSLVALVRPNAMEQHSSVIDYNVAVLRDAALEIFGLGMRAGGR